MLRSLFRVTRFQNSVVLLSLLIFCGFCCQAQAEKETTEEWNISADKITRQEKPQLIVAEGNVVLIKQEKLVPPLNDADLHASTWSNLLLEETEKTGGPPSRPRQPKKPVYQKTVTIQADRISYDVALETITAKGNLQIITSDDQLFASEGTLNLVKETGSFSNATVMRKEHELHLEGKKIEKTGLDTYRIDDGWVITCKLDEGQSPPWSFSSTKTTIRQDGYAVLRHAKFNINDIPIFYTPYLLVPVKNTRQTGFLFPELSSSKNNGFGFNIPFFFNISDSSDATFYSEYYNNRGFMPGIEFRYVASGSEKGMIAANYLHDSLSDPSETGYYSDTDYTHDNKDRYWLRGKADHTFGLWQTRLDLDIVSDQDYLEEFDSGETGFEKSHERYLEVFGRGFQNKSESQRDNSFKTLRSWNGMSLQTSLLAINDADTTADSTDTPLWKLPSINFSGVIPLGQSSFFLDWDTNYVNYWREDGLGGHRVDITPSIATTVPLGPYIESRAELALRDTFYMVETYGDAEWNNNRFQNRLYPEFEMEVATTLEKDFFLSPDGNRSASHQLRPYIVYNYLPADNQDQLPELDIVDRIDDRQLLTYGVDNYLNLFSHSKEAGEIQNNYAELKIEQSYDLRSSLADRPFSEIISQLKWNPLTGTYISYKNYYDVYDNEFNRHTLEAQYINSRGDYLTLDYSYKDAENIEEITENIEQINGHLLAHIIDGWVAEMSIEHSLSQKETIEARGSLTYQAACWSLKFETRYTPEDTTYLVVFSLANIGFPLGVNF